MRLFLLEVIKTRPSGMTEFLGAFLVLQVSVFHARMIRLSRHFVGSRNEEGGRDCGLPIRVNVTNIAVASPGDQALLLHMTGSVTGSQIDNCYTYTHNELLTRINPIR